MEKIKQLLKTAVNDLKESESESPILDAELLMVYTLNNNGISINRSMLMLRYDEIIDAKLETEYKQLVERRMQGEPVQYITGTQEFMGLDLHVQPGVLIPRPDTEILVEKVIQLSKDKKSPIIIDMCTGSGAIAVSLAYYIKESVLYAVDISDHAIDCSSINASRHNVERRVTVVKSDLFERLENLKNSVDIIVSNPPYIPGADISGLQKGVREYEPVIALDGGRDGLDFYRRIVYNAFAYLKSGGILAFEIGYNQGHDVAGIIEGSGHFRNIGIEKDLAGLDRCVWAYRV